MIELFSKNNDNESEISLKNLLETVQRQIRKNKKLKIKSFQKHKPSSKISTSLLNKSQEIINNFRQCKSKYNEKRDTIRNVLFKNLQKVEYNETRNKKFLNSDNPEDIETNFKILERSNSKEKKSRKLNKSPGLQITEKILIYDFPKQDRLQTKDQIKLKNDMKLEERNGKKPPGKNYHTRKEDKKEGNER